MVPETSSPSLVVIYFVYGLAFFSLGLAIILEGWRSTDTRLRLALRPLAAFGLIHGLHEWMDMIASTGILASEVGMQTWWVGIRLSLLSFSFLSLAGFGFSALAPSWNFRRLSLLAPLMMASIWSVGCFYLLWTYPSPTDLLPAVDVWTRYSLGIPSALIASIGLIVQQRAFRKAGMAQFGRDSFIAAIAFAWYGLVGQLFVRTSRLSPSTFINEELFMHWFQFPVQFLRAALAVVVAISVIRFMRSFDTEAKRELASLQKARLQEAQDREMLRGELLHRVVTAQEAERMRVARELHDETGQSLTAIGMGLRALSDTMPRNPDNARSILKRLENLVADSLNELQRMISDLRPTHLDDLGLPAALRWYLGDIGQRTKDLEIKFSLAGDSYSLAQPVSLTIYRIVQEAITNVIKHSQANLAEVTLCYHPGQTTIEVRDNGIGMNLNQINGSRRPWGLLGMRERVTLLGGDFEIYSRPREGTRVMVSIPTQSTVPSASAGNAEQR
jgi:signal transduction histidine kinase